MVKVEQGFLKYESDAGFVKLEKHDIRAAQVKDFEGKNYLLIRLVGGSQLQVLPDYPKCELMDYCVANGYQYCLPLGDEDYKEILKKLQ